ncbi:PucR family transcriptional regulator [Gordonia araii]|nr:PucR family transcriptional regulator [Gordonia araii]NNG97994.1 helix-turn-helix domain-containing protein [Gordonia araii NBRC 100433]
MSHSLAEPRRRSVLAHVDPDALTRSVTDEILAGEDAYAERTMPRDLLDAVTRDNILALFAAIDGETLDLEPARRVGSLKAELGIPLAGVMHAYRIAGIKLWHEIGDVAAGSVEEGGLFELGMQVWSILDQFSTAAAEAHREVTDSRGRWVEQTRIAAVLDLLDDASDPQQRDHAAAVLGWTDDSRLVVVATDSPISALSTSDGPAGAIQWVDRGGLRMGVSVVSGGTTRRRWTPDLDARIGVSEEFDLLQDAPTGGRQAALALRCAGTARAGVVHYGEMPVETLVVSQPAVSLEVAAQILGGLADLPEDDRNVLLDTVEAWIELDGSSSKAAGRLHCHRNTVLYRLRRVEKLTGRSVAKPADVVALGVAVLARRHLG